MDKKNLLCTVSSLIVMLVLPWAATCFIKGDGGMLVCFLLFFGVNPMLAAGVGCFAGAHWKRAWFQPLLCAALFVTGAWLVFDMGEPAFLMYAGVYLALGYAAAAVSWLISKNRR